MNVLERDYQRLFHIVKYCEKLNAVKKEVNGDFNEFIDKSNYQKVDVSAFYIGQIGELVHGLTEDFKNNHFEMSWKQIVDTRNILIHRYGTRDNKIIWDIIDKDIPQLKKYCKKNFDQKKSSYRKKNYSRVKRRNRHRTVIF